MFLHRVLEFTAGGIFLVAIPLRAEQLIKCGKSRFIHPNTGQCALFVIDVLAQTLLESLISVGIDPVVFHLFQSGSGFDLLLQGHELIIAWFQLQSLLDGIQRTGLIAQMRPQFAQLQPDPGVVRLLLGALLRVVKCFFQPAAVHQRHRIPVVPGSAACGVLL